MRKRKFEITVYRDEPTEAVYVEGNGSGEDYETAAAAIVLSLIKMLKEDGNGYDPADILKAVCEFITDYVGDKLGQGGNKSEQDKVLGRDADTESGGNIQA